MWLSVCKDKRLQQPNFCLYLEHFAALQHLFTFWFNVKKHQTAVISWCFLLSLQYGDTCTLNYRCIRKILLLKRLSEKSVWGNEWAAKRHWKHWLWRQLCVLLCPGMLCFLAETLDLGTYCKKRQIQASFFWQNYFIWQPQLKKLKWVFAAVLCTSSPICHCVMSPSPLPTLASGFGTQEAYRRVRPNCRAVCGWVHGCVLSSCATIRLVGFH